VPCIAMAGTSCQFFAVYLLKDNFPVLVALSPELNLFGTFEQQRVIAEWCLRVVSFASATEEMLQRHRYDQPLATGVCLNMSGYFAKPVGEKWRMSDRGSALYSGKNLRLNYIMRLYERIRVSCEVAGINSKISFLFPEGVVSIPGRDVLESLDLREMLLADCRKDGFSGFDESFTPLIIFPRLSGSEWNISKPPPEYRDQYVEQLKLAIAALNVSQVAHLDLRPANIMWRADGKGKNSHVELQVIDFEDAVLFNDVIPEKFVKAVVETGDRRYPFKSGDEMAAQEAKKLHNDFFLDAVSRWTESEIISWMKRRR